MALHISYFDLLSFDDLLDVFCYFNACAINKKQKLVKTKDIQKIHQMSADKNMMCQRRQVFTRFNWLPVHGRWIRKYKLGHRLTRWQCVNLQL